MRLSSVRLYLYYIMMAKAMILPTRTNRPRYINRTTSLLITVGTIQKYTVQPRVLVRIHYSYRCIHILKVYSMSP